MAERYQEYLRRNLLHAKACGAKANASTALKRLEMQTRPPQWLVNALRGILERVDPLPAELARWRDLAPDTPDFVRAEMETSPVPAPAGCEDWWHLKPYGYAPGGYIIRCHTCKQQVWNCDKRALNCASCATKAWRKANEQG